MRPVKEKQKQGGLLMKRIILDITGAHRFSSSPLKKLQLHGPRNPNTFPVQTSSPHPQTPKENRDIQKKSKFTEQYNPEQEFSLQSSFGNFIRSMQGRRLRIPGSGISPGGGNGNPLPYSCLGNPMGRGAWQATVHGVASGRGSRPSRRTSG